MELQYSTRDLARAAVIAAAYAALTIRGVLYIC